MKMNLRKLGDTVVALAASVAPVAAGSCRAYFYEEKEPLGLQEFARKKNGKDETVTKVEVQYINEKRNEVK